jgi:Flp pilus assembly protein TadG
MNRVYSRLRLAREELGQSMVEVALSLPLLCFVLIGGADVARAFAIQIAVQNGARAGAEASAIDFTPSSAEAITWTIDEMNRTPGMNAALCNPSSATCTITVTRKQANGTTDCLQTPTLATPCYFTVRVQYTWRTVIPWPLIPNQFQFDRSTSVRAFV